MRTLPPFTWCFWMVTLLLVTGCGNYSNEDLEFLSVLPTKDALETRLPENNQSGQKLQGLAVGEPSKLWTDTRNGAGRFNVGISLVLTTIDLIRDQPYSSQTKGSRTWGPWNDVNNPGFQVRVTMERTVSGSFDMKAEWKKTDTEESEWTPVFSGSLSKTASARRGTGTLRWNMAVAKQLGLNIAAEHRELEELTVTYQLQKWPAEVTETIRAVGKQPVDYSFQYFADGRGIIRFGFSAQILGGALSAEEDFKVETRWLPDGQGRAVATVTSADFLGISAQQIECWDTSKIATFIQQTWLGGIVDGVETACPDVVTGFE